MSDARFLLIAALAIAGHFFVPAAYAPYVLGATVFGLIIYLGFKIDDLRSGLTAAQRDIDDLKETSRKRDLEDRPR
jgi:hypothetical protein